MHFLELTAEEFDNKLKQIDENKTDLGNLAELTTIEKTNIVGAVNETQQLISTNVGDLGNLTTTDKSSLVNATNEVKNLVDSNEAETNLKIATVEKDLNDFERVITSLNPNQEAKQTVSGIGMVSLPKNAASGQVSVTLRGRSLKNELNYDRSSLTGWSKALATIENNQIVFTGDGVNTAYALKSDCTFETNTKYGMLLSVFSNDSGQVLKFNNNQLLNDQSYSLGSTSGNKKVVFTTKSSITINHADFHCYNMPNGTKIKFGDIRMFELPAGSEIETDFNTLTADQLAQKYPYINGDSVKSTVGALQLKSVGKNMFSDSEFNPSCWTKIGDGEFYNKIALIFYSPYVRWMKGKFKANTVYTIKYSIKAPTGKNPRIKVFYTDGTSSEAYAVSTGEYKTRTLVTENGKTVDYIGGTYSSSCDPGTLFIKDIQVEEGSVATEYEPYKESIVYINGAGELRSLPNGTKDEVNVTEGKATIRIGHKTDVASGIVINYVDMADGGQYYAWNNDGETETGIKGDTLEIDATTLTYQLATPIEIPIQTSGSLVSYPSGTVYIESAVADAGIYSDKMTVLHQDLPIKVLEKLSKIDFMTGLETELDVSDAVIAEDKLSFTHPDLTSGDIVFFVYEHGAEGTIPETEISYYDSRYVIKGEDDKFYQWEIEAKLVEGVITPSIKLVEV